MPSGQHFELRHPSRLPLLRDDIFTRPRSSLLCLHQTKLSFSLDYDIIIRPQARLLVTDGISHLPSCGHPSQ